MHAVIDKIEHFLLELGKGFLFESRQKRFTFDNNHFYVDLVFNLADDGIETRLVCGCQGVFS